jgi:cobyrinic acid a,c-diamide synthase
MGLAAAWRRRGFEVQTFKKGPDYIDAAWLTLASGQPTRNLDSFLMGSEGVKNLFLRHCQTADISLIEGNRGLFDGVDLAGTYSTAELAKLLKAPVFLVLDVTKVTRTAAAIVLGCRRLDPDVNIAGVILNHVAGDRHERVIRQAIESICGVPVIGALPSWEQAKALPGRHLGLVPPQEHADGEGLCTMLADILEQNVDMSVLLAIAGSAPSCEANQLPTIAPPAGEKVPIAWFHDSAFTFYYPDNLEALQTAGADLIPVNSLTDTSLPLSQGLYIGGGFPETHAARLSRNKPLQKAVAKAARAGLPVYAECGGLIYLCRSLSWKGKKYSLAGVFPIDLEMHDKPQGHGYMTATIDKENPWFAGGTHLKGHEFHYTHATSGNPDITTVYNVERGKGCFPGRDGLIFKNTLASYMHLHAAGTPTWAARFVTLARAYR